MKLYISVDMEGMAGITHPTQEREDQAIFRDAMHRQVEWVLEGIQQSPRGGEVTEITISDSHGRGLNLSYERLCKIDERVSLISGSPRRQYMMAGLDDSYAMAFLVGYHAGAGAADACMEHCYNSRVVYNLQVNDRYMNEATTNAAYAGELGVPVTLVVGDSALEHQLISEQMMPWVHFVKTKTSVGRSAVKNVPQKLLRQNTIASVALALQGAVKQPSLYITHTPCKLEITFRSTAMAEVVAMVPGVARENSRTITVPCNSMAELLCGISALTALAATAE